MRWCARAIAFSVLVSGCFDSAEPVADATSTGQMTSTSAEATTGDGPGTSTTSSTGDTTSGTDTVGCDPCPGDLLSTLELPAFGGALAVTPDGGLLVAGSAAEDIEVLGTPLTPVGADTYLAAITPEGTLAWIREISSPGDDYPHRVHVTPDGLIALAGVYDGDPVTIAGVDPGEPQAGRNAYYALFDARGSLQRTHVIRTTASYFGGMTILPGSRVVAANGFAGDASHADGAMLTNQGAQDAYFVAFDADGNVTTLRGYGSGLEDYARGIAHDNLVAGSSYVVGAFSDTIDFEGNELTSDGGTDVFVMRIDTLANVAWAVAGHGAGNDEAVDVAVDGQGRAYVVGNYREDLQLPGGDLLDAEGESDIFVAVFEPDGGLVWVRGFGGPGAEQARAVDVTVEGNVILAGEFSGMVDFGMGPLQSEGSIDAVVASYGPDGTARWTYAYGDMGDDRGGAVAVGPDSVFVGVSILGTVDFGGTALGEPGQRMTVIAEYVP